MCKIQSDIMIPLPSSIARDFINKIERGNPENVLDLSLRTICLELAYGIDPDDLHNNRDVFKHQYRISVFQDVLQIKAFDENVRNLTPVVELYQAVRYILEDDALEQKQRIMRVRKKTWILVSKLIDVAMLCR